MSNLENTYSICVIDIGLPTLGNLGWCLIHTRGSKEYQGENLDDLFPPIASVIKRNGLILGLEAPLFVPLRENLAWATKSRKGERRRAWSAGAEAQVLAINLPIMVYMFKKIQSVCADISYVLNKKIFRKTKRIHDF